MSIEKPISSKGGAVRVTGRSKPLNDHERLVRETRPATSELVDAVTRATWEAALAQLGELPTDPLPLWTMLASRILRAVAHGERDPERLKRLALDGVNNHDWFGTPPMREPG
jgi:hypothetical protein